MKRIIPLFVLISFAVPVEPARAQSSWEDLVVFFREWREFERPEFVGGVPDYTPEAMAAQQRALREWKERLWAFDIADWPVEQQIDWHLVRAEMNGLDFDHKIRRPWARDPAF
ncbi:MAG: hypothetical protein R3304_09595, partial [Longimicrobiales bacterium]|nr:hypothetical protein [Longimicrobiales bacterium]